MRVVWTPLALAAAFGLSGCVSPPPAGPTVLAVPGPNKSLAQFQVEDARCRIYAQTAIGPTSPSRAAGESGAGSAAAIGAVPGNPAAGAAVGAGTGLVVGAGAGSANAAYSGAAVQRSYDVAYIQCMVSDGDKVQSYSTYAAAGPGPYAYLPYPYAYPFLGYGYGYPAYFGWPVVAFGFGGGWGGGWGGWHGGWGGWHGGRGGGYHGGGRWWH